MHTHHNFQKKIITVLQKIGILSMMCSVMACQQQRNSSPVAVKQDSIEKTESDTITKVQVEQKKIEFYNPIILEVDDDFNIKLLGTVFTTNPTTPSLNNIVKNYLNTCYTDHHRLPDSFIVRYTSLRTKQLSYDNIASALTTAIEGVRNHVPGSTAKQMEEFPILYETKFKTEILKTKK